MRDLIDAYEDKMKIEDKLIQIETTYIDYPNRNRTILHRQDTSTCYSTSTIYPISIMVSSVSTMVSSDGL